jgi:imidazolonepropionase-like amidohydrolase
MFIKGSRLAIEAGLDTLEHCTVDECYSPSDAKAMAAKGVAIIPTLTLGGFLAMNCGSRGYPDDPEVQFFSGLRRRHLRRAAEQVALPELRQCFFRFFDWLDACKEDRRMPMVGQVYPDRVHGFARCARDSIRSFQDAGVRVGVGTDGGTGVTFCGFLHGELEALHRYGYSKADVLRMATLGNMEILGLDQERGSLEKGKFADIVVLESNPLDSLDAYDGVKMVFREGRLLVERSDGSAALKNRQVENPER